MYRVMVVEDSKPIMGDILNQLAAIDKRLELVDIAYNGTAAVDKLRTNSIDILLTDIKMPLMDGLDLIREAKKLQPHIQCIIISGYSDFEYARNAIKLQVSEYILKPIEPEDLRKAVANVLEQINRNKYERIRNELDALMAYKWNMRKNAKGLSSDLLSISSFALIIVRAGLSKNCSHILDTAAAGQLLRSAVGEYNFFTIPTGVTYELAYLFNLSELENINAESNILILLRELREIFSQSYQPINLIVSPKCSDIFAVAGYYTNLSTTLSSQIQIGKSRIIFSDALKEYSLDTLNSEVIVFKKKFGSLIRHLKIQLFMNEFSNCMMEWADRSYPLIFVRRFLAVIVDESSKVFAQSHEIVDLSFELELLLEDCFTYEDIGRKVEKYLQGASSKKHDKAATTEDLVVSIRKFMQQNIYGNMTMSELSNWVGVSPSYINRLMKNRWEQSPMDYYISLKIKEAKYLLYNNSGILIKDVSDSLGFSDQQYFSKVFKAHVGMSPAEFRNSKGRKE